MPPLCPEIHLQSKLPCKTVPSLYHPAVLPPAQEHPWVFKRLENPSQSALYVPIILDSASGNSPLLAAPT